MINAFTYEVFLAQNRLRADPESILPRLEAHLTSFESLRGGFHDNPQFRGREAVYNAISRIQGKYITYQEPLHWDDCLALSAREHCLDQGAAGLVGH